MKREHSSVPRTFVLGVLAALPLIAACEDGTSADSARIHVQITDAPSDFIQSAEIWVSRVYLQGGPSNPTDTLDASTSGRVDLFNKPSAPFHVDLLLLRNGLVASLTDSVSVPAGSYKQLRIVVDSAKVTLKAGSTFASGGTTMALKIPSGSSSGVKVDLSTALEATEGGVTSLLVDFDVNQNFVIQGGSTTSIQGILFTPRIKEMNRSHTSS